MCGLVTHTHTHTHTQEREREKRKEKKDCTYVPGRLTYFYTRISNYTLFRAVKYIKLCYNRHNPS